MEEYIEANTPALKEFSSLLKEKYNKAPAEGTVIENAKITKVGKDHCFVSIEGVKSEALISKKEMTEIGLSDKIKEMSNTHQTNETNTDE